MLEGDASPISSAESDLSLKMRGFVQTHLRDKCIVKEQV